MRAPLALADRAERGLVRRLVLREAHVAVRAEDVERAPLLVERHEQLAHRAPDRGLELVAVCRPVRARVVPLEPLVEREALGRKASERHPADPTVGRVRSPRRRRGRTSASAPGRPGRAATRPGPCAGAGPAARCRRRRSPSGPRTRSTPSSRRSRPNADASRAGPAHRSRSRRAAGRRDRIRSRPSSGGGGTQQHGPGVTRWRRRDHVGAPVHPVDEVHVEPARSAEHRRVATRSDPGTRGSRDPPIRSTPRPPRCAPRRVCRPRWRRGPC